MIGSSMAGPSMTAWGLTAGAGGSVWIACLLGLAVVLGSARMLWRLHRVAPTARPRAWRTLTLLLIQATSATLLYLTLLPPQVPREAGTLVVLTARSGEVAAPGVAGERVVALPEALAPSGVERVPDLAAALRRYPATKRVRVLGAGLVARDRKGVAGTALEGRAIEFLPAPQPRGLAELQAPTQVPAGRQFRIAGRGEQLPDGAAELLDPAGHRIDHATLADDGRFVLHGTTRGAGLAAYRLRLHDARAQVVEEIELPLQVEPARELRVLVLAGAPNPELKYLRRWALDAGNELDTRISLGAGLQIGTAAVGFDPASLAELDLLVLDERSWRALGSGQRAALSSAIQRGLGLLLRMTGPVTGTDRQRLAALGFNAVREGVVRETRLGGSFVRAEDAVDALPTLARSAWAIDAGDGVTLLDDAAGTPMTVWRASGRGRIGVSTLADSYRLVLAGRSDTHGEIWGRTFTVLARPGGESTAVVADADGGMARIEQRVSLCDLADGARITAPDGREVDLHVDPASGARRCAGFWPQTAGWHLLHEGAGARPLHVRGTDAAPGLQAHAMREATQALAAGAPDDDDRRVPQATRPGPRWPWFLGWLLLTTAGWWFERMRAGAPRTMTTST